LQDPLWTDTVSEANGYDGTGIDICGPRTCIKTLNSIDLYYETSTRLNWGTGQTDSDSDIGAKLMGITCTLNGYLSISSSGN